MFETEHQLTRKADDRGRVNLGAEYADKDVTLDIKRGIRVSDLPTMRAVHFFSPDDKARARLYAGIDRPGADALFGVHWGTGPVWAERAYEEDKRNHQSAIKDYNAMQKAAKGAIVAAYYGSRKEDLEEDDAYCLNDYIVVGVCPPGASVQPIPYEEDSGEYQFVKTLPLVNTVEVSRDEYPGLFEDHVKGLSIYETIDKEKLIRDVYSHREH